MTDLPTPHSRFIRVLIVDDSASVRAILSRKLGDDPMIEIVGLARDGIEGVEMVRDLKPDVVTLDVEMPRQNGLQTIEKIMRDYPTPVVMVSSLTAAGTETTVRALEAGAIDFVQKPMHSGIAAVHEITGELLEKIKIASRSNLRRATARLSHASREPQQITPSHAPVGGSWLNRVVVVGSSTGGPPALREGLTALPRDLRVPLLVVQHMPAGFTKALADRLNTQCAIEVREAKPGDHMTPGVALLAPGGFHMVIERTGEIRLTMAATECGVRPAINVTLESVQALHGRRTLGVILTGMGNDGTRGAGLVKRAGGTIIAEDESTCAVYGMPRSVFEAGFTDVVVPLPRIASEIIKACRPVGVAA